MKNAGKACNNRLYRHIRTFEKIVKNYFVIFSKEITKQVSYELLALRAIKIFSKDFRVYLKTGNMTNSEGFFAC